MKRKLLPLRRRSSYLEPSAETLASLNTDFSKLPSYRTAAELIRSLEKKS